MSAAPTVLIKANGSSHNGKKSLVKSLDGNTRLFINKVPATVKPTMKRHSTSTLEPALKSTKYSLQTIASAGTPLTSLQWQTIGGANGTTITATPSRKQQLGAVISSLPPNTIIQAKSSGQVLNAANARTLLQTTATANGVDGTTATMTSTGHTFKTITTTHGGATLQVRRPTLFIKREMLKRSIRDITLELIEKNPLVHLGVAANRLSVLKMLICETANVSDIDCYLTLKKLRQNEDFSLLAEYFEMSEADVQQAFAQTIVRLARFLRFLVRWPDSKKYYDRHKSLPFAFRPQLSHVQSLIECVETEMNQPHHIECSSYKYILCITPNSIISYISEAYIGRHDDLTIFSASNFHNVIPKYLSLVADPGKAIRQKRVAVKQEYPAAPETDSTTDSADESVEEDGEADHDRSISRYEAARIAGELASYESLSVVNNELTSRRVKDFTIPTMRVREPICRDQIRDMIDCLRDFKILQPHAIKEPLIYQYINEILQCVAGLVNFQR